MNVRIAAYFQRQKKWFIWGGHTLLGYCVLFGLFWMPPFGLHRVVMGRLRTWWHWTAWGVAASLLYGLAKHDVITDMRWIYLLAMPLSMLWVFDVCTLWSWRWPVSDQASEER